MTVTYTAEVATCRGFGCFLKLLIRWRGSIYKLVWLDLAAFLFVYYVLNIIYRFALNPYQKTIFEAVVQYCYNYSTLIPLSFVLGFYVSIVMTRWWNQYISIPWPDPIAVFVSANIHGQDERGRVMRRTVMRYVCLCLTMVLTNVSPRVKKRFPHLNNLVEAGLLNENEKEIIESMNKGFPRHSKHWLPIVWAASIVTRARKEGRIRDDFAVKTIIDELNKFRGQCGLLISYDTISVPLVYTQVVTLAVYSYFLCSVMGQQWTEGKVVANSNFVNKIDLYFPVFTTLEFFFYMGWLKVAESLINPFGEDDDDFEVNWMVDRNLQVSYLIVDEMHHEHPELIKDQYWDEIFPNELPYTVASERFREEHPEPSTAKIEVSKTAAMSTTMSGVRIDDMVGTTVTTTPTVEGNKLLPSTSIEQSVLYKFPDGIQEEEADDTSGIHFTAGNVKTRPGSSPSLVSLSGTISRVNTVASALKRLLSRDDSRTGSVTPIDGTEKQYRFPGSVSGTSLVTNVNANKPSDNVRRIANEVIEEVDEQTTITSQKGANDNSSMRPNVRDIFNTKSIAMSSIQKTDPVVYFDKNKIYTRTQSNVETNLLKDGDVDALLLSSSAPATGSPTLAAAATPLFPQNSDSTRSLYDERNKPQSAKSIKNSCGPKSLNFKWFLSTVEGLDTKSTSDITEPIKEVDDFDKLKAVREKERTERQNKLIVRSISTVTGGEQMASPTTTVPSNIVTPSSSHLLLLSSSSAHTTISPEMTVTTATTATAATIKTITTNSSSQLTEPGIE